MSDFIRKIIKEDLAKGTCKKIHTRFPPEPSGFPHIGHVKAIYLNFAIANEFGGLCNLRFDDTNPEKAKPEFIKAIKNDIAWLGFDWGDRLLFASDYFERLYELSVKLVKAGKAYVCDLSAKEVNKTRGTLTTPGEDSPFRERSIEENLALFKAMRAGEFEDGTRTLRAKISMSLPNLVMRDPIMYRIRHVTHPRRGDEWPIYPTYDFAQVVSDSDEGVTHSLCDTEFDVRRPLYEWFLKEFELTHKPKQLEFSRLNITHTVTSKRKLRKLVNEELVDGWDDPRMPTLSGLRRLGVPPKAILDFVHSLGVGRTYGCVEAAQLTAFVRKTLEDVAPRRMAVLRPLKVIVTNYPKNEIEHFTLPNHPTKAEMGSRKVPFSRVLYIDRDDFRETPPPKFHRLSPGKEVRLRGAYFLRCTKVLHNEKGEVIELHCTFDEKTRGGKNPPDGRKVKATIHWVSADHAVPFTSRLFGHLFASPEAYAEDTPEVSSDSLEELTNCLAEPAILDVLTETFQLERVGYFCKDSVLSEEESLVLNRTTTLRDKWKRLNKVK